MDTRKQPAPPSAFDASMGTRLPLRILLAEDNLVNQKVALRLLERLGYRADVANNGLEVLERVARTGYDVVLMDVQMPDMDGLEATRTLVARYDARRRPYIVALTANALAEDRHRAFDAGMNHYVSKPVRPNLLVQALEAAAAWKTRHAEAARPPHPGTAPFAGGTLPRAMLDTLLDLVGDDAAFLLDLIESYRDNAPELLAAIETALHHGDATALDNAAHTLKSSSAMMGCAAFAARCGDLEEACNQDPVDPARLAVLVQAAKDAYRLVEAALDTLARRFRNAAQAAPPARRNGFGLEA